MDEAIVEKEDDNAKVAPTVFGAEIMEAAIAEPTLDRFLDGNPKIFLPTEEAYTPLVARLRRDRAAFITAEAKALARKNGDKDDEE